MKVNLYAPFRLCQVFAPPMMERGWGRIINIASVYGHTGPKPQLYPETWGPSSYFASKHGINGITHYLSPRLARHGVTINSMSPGGIVTDDQRLGLDEAGKKRLANAAPFAEAQVQIGRTGDGSDYVGPGAAARVGRRQVHDRPGRRRRRRLDRLVTGAARAGRAGRPAPQARAEAISRCV